MRIHWLGVAIVLGAMAYFARGGGWFVALLLLPLLAWYASRILVHGGFDLWRHARHGHKAEWHGRHYEYGDRRLRAEETEADELVFLEDDLLAVIEQPRSATLALFGPAERVMLADSKEMALTQAGCERLLMKCPHRDAKKLLLYLQREAFFPHAKKRERICYPGSRKLDENQLHEEKQR